MLLFGSEEPQPFHNNKCTNSFLHSHSHNIPTQLCNHSHNIPSLLCNQEKHGAMCV